MRPVECPNDAEMCILDLLRKLELEILTTVEDEQLPVPRDTGQPCVVLAELELDDSQVAKAVKRADRHRALLKVDITKCRAFGDLPNDDSSVRFLLSLASASRTVALVRGSNAVDLKGVTIQFLRLGPERSRHQNLLDRWLNRRCEVLIDTCVRKHTHWVKVRRVSEGRLVFIIGDAEVLVGEQGRFIHQAEWHLLRC